jgi:glycosyltransferase involved in cell wall biosynthesis
MENRTYRFISKPYSCSFWERAGIIRSPIAEKLNLPLITTFHGSDITQRDKFPYNKKHRKIVFQQSSKIIAVSKFIENKLLKAGCPQKKSSSIILVLIPSIFHQWVQKSEQPTILFVGRLIEQKGCQVFDTSNENSSSTIT